MKCDWFPFWKFELFNELYGCYYSTIYHILKETANKELTDDDFRKIIKLNSDRYGFSGEAGFPGTTNLIVEKAINIGKAENSEHNKDAWPLFFREEEKHGDRKRYYNKSKLQCIKGIPLSTIEKMWLKSIYSDPRIQLFLEDGVSLPELEGVDSLFNWDDYVLFDQYQDGDPFQDERYIKMFRKILKGVRNQSRLKIKFNKSNNKVLFNEDGSYKLAPSRGEGTIYIDPDHIEYSERDNKFRLIGSNPRFGRNMVNIASVIDCQEVKRFEFADDDKNINAKDSFQRKVLYELKDDNNALERFLFSFSHYEKEADFVEAGGKQFYRIKLTYDETDETDLVIRTLSFGPHVWVVEPDYFVGLIRDRLQKQRNLLWQKDGVC